MSSLAPPVVRVICTSLSLVQGSVMEELLALRQEFCAFGSLCGVRSALFYASGWFFQWHEGPAEGVEKMLRAVAADQRQKHMRVLHRSLGAATLNEPLQIATLQNQDKPTDVARRVFLLQQDQATGSAAQPRELWRMLVAATGSSAPGMARADLGQRHVVGVVSGDSGALDLVRAIGLRLGAPVSYQRFATGAHRSADFGAVYVDLPAPFYMMRLQALSRRSLSHPTVGLLMEDVRCVLMLLGEGPDRARALADDVAAMLQRHALRPVVRLSGGGAAAAQMARGCLRACSGDIGEIESAALYHAGPAALFQSLLGARHENGERVAQAH